MGNFLQSLLRAALRLLGAFLQQLGTVGYTAYPLLLCSALSLMMCLVVARVYQIITDSSPPEAGAFLAVWGTITVTLYLQHLGT